MIQSLWQQRERLPFASLRFFKQWAKRVLTFRSLINMQWESNRLRWRGAQIDSTTCISPNRIEGAFPLLKIGAHSFIGRATIRMRAPVSIGAYVCINDGVEILTGSHALDDPEWRMYAKPVVIEDYAWIATGATILPGVTVGKGAVVGAKAVVRKSVPPFAVVIGNPATPIETQRPENLRYDPTRFLAFQEAWLGNAHRDSNAQSSR